MGTITDFITEGTIGLSLRPKRYDIELYQGDTFEVTLVFKDINQLPVNLTGVGYDCRFAAVAPTAAPTVQPTVSALTPTNGEVTILIENTSSLSGNYTWDLQLLNGTKKRTYIGGAVTITSDLTA